MDNNKLYNALLKTQERHKAEQAARSKEGEAEATIAQFEEVKVRSEPARPYPRDIDESVRPDRIHTAAEPNWTRVEPERRPPSLYDSSVSLELIDNPRPWTEEELRERKIIFPGMANRSILDAFREVRIKLKDKGGPVNFSVMVSSLGKEDTSALTAFNLAATFAMDAQTSALLVDCNPWDSDLSQLVSTPMAKGVTDFVADKELKAKDIIYPSGLDRLSIVPAGSQATSAVELFSSVRMRDLMGELKGRYPDRFLIINAPPLKASTEAQILVRYANQLVLSVPFGEVSPDEIVSSVEMLGSEKFSGLIFQQ